MEPDGSIRAGNDSFVINPDGSGYFSGGRFRWNKDSIILQDVTIRWEDLDEEMQEQMKPVSSPLMAVRCFIITMPFPAIFATRQRSS